MGIEKEKEVVTQLLRYLYHHSGMSFKAEEILSSFSLDSLQLKKITTDLVRQNIVIENSNEPGCVSITEKGRTVYTTVFTKVKN